MNDGLCSSMDRMNERMNEWMNRFHKTLGVLHIVELAPWLWFAEGALQLKPTCLLLLTRRQQSADHEDKVCQVGVTVNTE